MSLSPAISLTLVVVAGLAAAGLTLLLRRTVPSLSRIDPGPWSSTLQYVATAFGVVIGFSILYLFGAFADARSAVGDEATSIGTAFDEVSLFDQAAPDVQQALVCYARAASTYDWPAMREGTSAPEVDLAYSNLVDSLGQGDEPLAGTFDGAVATNVVVQVGAISTARETRLVAAATSLPHLMWGLVIGGGLLVVVLLFVVTMPASPGTQALLLGLATAFTAVLVLLVVALNNPFAAGPGRVSPALIDDTTTSMEQSAPGLADQPCAVDGTTP
jgi:hypothetical protein